MTIHGVSACSALPAVSFRGQAVSGQINRGDCDSSLAGMVADVVGRPDRGDGSELSGLKIALSEGLARGVRALIIHETSSES